MIQRIKIISFFMFRVTVYTVFVLYFTFRLNILNIVSLVLNLDLAGICQIGDKTKIVLEENRLPSKVLPDFHPKPGRS